MKYGLTKITKIKNILFQSDDIKLYGFDTKEVQF